MSLAGKRALVTGASRGIGRAIAMRLAREGAAVAVHYARGVAEAEAVVASIVSAGGRARAVPADLALPEGPGALAAALGGEPLDVLVNNAGIGERIPFMETDAAHVDLTLALNLRAPFLLIQACLPLIPDGGRIVNLSSTTTRIAFVEMAAYAASKAGVEALTMSLAPELGKRGITINAIRPGATLTDMNARLRDPAVSAEVARAIALGRVGEPEDVAEVVAFLASDAARWITGTTIDVSGGQRL